MAPVFNPINYDIPLTNRGITIRASSITCLVFAHTRCCAKKMSN